MTVGIKKQKKPQRNVVKSSNLGEKNMWCCVVVDAKEDKWKISYAWPKSFLFIFNFNFLFLFYGEQWEINGQCPRCSGKSITNII